LTVRYLGRRSVSSGLTTLFNVVWYVSIVSGCALALGTAVSAVLHIAGVVDLGALVGAGHHKITLRSPGAEIVLQGPGVQPSLGSLATVIGVALVLIPVWLLMLNHLRRLMASAAHEHPFTEENVGRIRWLGYLFMIGAVLQSIVEVVVGYHLSRVSIPGVEINARIGLNFPAMIAGFVILVLAEVFRLGVELKEDQDLTV
jgi:hypothetical protein